jgi:hypothetical protein
MLRGDVARRSVSIPIGLPAGSAQGRAGRWFVMRLHIRMRVAPGTRAGFADVSALLNGRSAMLVELEVRPRPGGGGRVLTWATAGLIDGAQTGAGPVADTGELGYSNYVQGGSVRGGRSRLTFRIERFRGLRLRSVEILADSGILSTALSPPRLRLAVASRAQGDPAVGRPLTIGFRLANQGGCPARDVEVGMIYPHDALAAVGPARRRVGVVTHGATGTLTLRPRLSGAHRVVVGVNGSANHPGMMVTVPVAAHPSHRGTVLLVASMLLAGAATIVSLRWRGWRPAR